MYNYHFTSSVVYLKFFITFYLILFSLIGYGQNYSEEFDEILQQEFSELVPGVTALVAHRGKILYDKSIGVSDLEHRVQMKPDHVFRIASITKQFTATAILKLQEQNKLSLDDEVEKYIPELPKHEIPVTIRNLLTHTSGVKNYTSIPGWDEKVRGREMTPSQVVEIIKDEPLDFDPGSKYNYSNVGYMLLGQIIEVVSGQSYATFLRENFFEPLGMLHTQYDEASLIIPNRVHGYTYNGDNYLNSEFINMSLPHAGGGLLSTSDDLFRWYQALFKGSVLTEDNLQLAHQPFHLNDGSITEYGFGWEIGNIRGRHAIKHGGRINGFISFVLYLPAEEIFVTLLSNCMCADDLEMQGSKMAALVLRDPYGKKEVKTNRIELANYQGVYISSEGQERIVRLEDGRLVIYAKGRTKEILRPVGKSTFNFEDKLSSIEFRSDLSDLDVKSNSFTLHTLGLPSHWNRVAPVVQINSLEMDSTFEIYHGKYDFAGLFVFEIAEERGKLFGIVGNDKHEIKPYGEQKFFSPEIDADLTFENNAAGDIIGLTIYQNTEVKGIKIE